MENWKDIKDYKGIYQVSDLGRVKSLKFNKERILKLCKDSYGYLTCGLSKENKKTTRTVHVLVAESFLKHKRNGNTLVTDHVNNDRLDNRLVNLQLISHRENCSKDRKGGTSKYRGVSLRKSTQKYQAQIRIKGKSKHLGYFNTQLEASKAYQNALNNLNKKIWQRDYNKNKISEKLSNTPLTPSIPVHGN
jgi:hypothetical protein